MCNAKVCKTWTRHLEFPHNVFQATQSENHQAMYVVNSFDCETTSIPETSPASV